MIKIFSILILCAYIFGITKLGIVYSAHNVLHHICNDTHSDKDCDGTCTIIIDAEKSEKSQDNKTFKINIDNISSHILYNFNFTPEIHKQSFIPPYLFPLPSGASDLNAPPPRI